MVRNPYSSKLIRTSRMIKPVLFTGFIILLISILLSKFVIVTSKNEQIVFGIIDEAPTEIFISQTNNVIFSNEQFSNIHENNHGDTMLDFALNIAPNATIYYFVADNEEGSIDSSSIIQGLEWLKLNNVKYVNISLSSKYKNDLLQEYINNNNTMEIFSSYNNKASDFDFPASFKNVIGVGKLNQSNINTIDIPYKTYDIILFGNNKINLYQGNSFLSLLETIKHSIEKEH